MKKWLTVSLIAAFTSISVNSLADADSKKCDTVNSATSASRCIVMRNQFGKLGPWFEYKLADTMGYRYQVYPFLIEQNKTYSTLVGSLETQSLELKKFNEKVLTENESLQKELNNSSIFKSPILWFCMGVGLTGLSSYLLYKGFHNE